MRARAVRDPRLEQLLRDAAARPITDAVREQQLVSIAYGNLKMENDRVTRAMVEDALRAHPPRR